MKVKSSKPKGQRIFKCMKFAHRNTNIKTIRPFWIEPIENDIWFDSDKLEWVKNPKKLVGLSSSYYSMNYHGLKNAYSLKAVLRLVNKWKAPKGTIFRASLPFIDYDFFITKK